MPLLCLLLQIGGALSSLVGHLFGPGMRQVENVGDIQRTGYVDKVLEDILLGDLELGGSEGFKDVTEVGRELLHQTADVGTREHEAVRGSSVLALLRDHIGTAGLAD